jgi:hypothetical protein
MTKSTSNTLLHALRVLGFPALLLSLSACGGGKTDATGPVTPPVVPAPAISTMPQNASVPPGAVATFSVVASGSNLSYRWSRNGEFVGGATAATYTSTPAQASESGTVIRAHIKSDNGTAVSTAAILTVSGTGIRPFAGAAARAGAPSLLPGAIPVDGLRGNVDGLGQEARVFSILGMAIDGAGNLYAADLDNYSVRKISPDGYMSTLAGSGVRGELDGPGNVAMFDNPRNIAVTESGTVFIQDEPMNSNKIYPIRKITPAGVVSTLSVPSDPLNRNADGTQALEKIRSFTVDSADNLYVVTYALLRDGTLDGYQRFTIRKITPSGITSTLLTTESANASFKPLDPYFHLFLRAVAVDPSGALFAATGTMIFKVTEGGGGIRLAGAVSPSRPRAAPDNFSDLTHMTADASGNLYVIDFIDINTGSRSIKKVTPSGAITLLAGDGITYEQTTMGNLPGRMVHCAGLAVDKRGDLYTSTTRGIIKIVLK